jgi:rubrerythrin
MFSATVDRLKRLVGSAPDPDEEDADANNDGPDLYECEGCGSVFISKPDQCSTCEDDDFSNVGKFQ